MGSDTEVSEADLYMERITHIVADIHERVRQPETRDRGVPDTSTDQSLSVSASSFLSQQSSYKSSNLSIPGGTNQPHLLP